MFLLFYQLLSAILTLKLDALFLWWWCTTVSSTHKTVLLSVNLKHVLRGLLWEQFPLSLKPLFWNICFSLLFLKLDLLLSGTVNTTAEASSTNEGKAEGKAGRDKGEASSIDLRHRWAWQKVNRIIGPGDRVLISGAADCPIWSAKEKMTLCSPSLLGTCCCMGGRTGAWRWLPPPLASLWPPYAAMSLDISTFCRN